MWELKPCPFCGCPKVWVGKERESEHFVQCDRCCAATGFKRTADAACRAWNRRVAAELNRKEKGKA